MSNLPQNPDPKIEVEDLSSTSSLTIPKTVADTFSFLKNSRWCLLKHCENLTEKQTVKLKELLQYNLRSVRAYLMREDFQRFWRYRSAHWAGRFLDAWCTRAMRSQIIPMKKMADTLRSHRKLL